MRLIKLICGTDDSWVQLVLRLGLAIVIFPHGAQKVLGWFGGNGFSATMQSFTENMNIPAVFALLAILAEFLGPVALALGVFARLAAAGIGTVMVVAISMVHLPHGFFMNWHGAQKGEGFEYHLLAITLAVGLLIGGAGRWSIDRTLSRRSKP